MNGHSLRYILREGISNIFLHSLASFTAVSIMIACLIIIGSFVLTAANINQMMQMLEKENEVVAFVDDSLTDRQVQTVGRLLQEIGNVSEVVFVSKDEGLAQFRQTFDDPSMLDGLENDNPLPDKYIIRVHSIDTLSETIKEIYNVSGVTKVRAGEETAAGMVNLRKAAYALATAFICILGAVSIYIITNTIRIGAFTRREEIGIMKMVGATNGYVSGSFLVEGLIVGGVAATIAYFLQEVIYNYVVSPILLGPPFLHAAPFSDMSTIILVLFGVLSVIIGVMSSLIAIRRFLRV